MLNLLKLYYKLNQEKFFSDFPLLSELDLSYKKLIYSLSVFFRTLVFICILFIMNIYITTMNVDLSYYFLSQILIVLFCMLVLSSTSIMQNRNTNSLKFLLSKIFSKTEIDKNIQQVSIYHALVSLILTIGLELSLLKYFARFGFYLVFNSLVVIAITTLYVYFRNKQRVKYLCSDDKVEKQHNWVKNYILALFMSGCIIFYIKDFTISSSLYFNKLKNIFDIVLLFSELFLVTEMIRMNIAQPKNRRKEESSFIKDGLIRDYFENYIKDSAYWYIIPPTLIRIIEISQLSKVIIIIIFTSFMMTPNYCNLKIINYQKVVGIDKNNIISNYAKKIFMLFIVVQLFQLILTGVNIQWLFFGILISWVLFATRTILGKLIIATKVSDMRKADLYAISVFLLLLLHVVIAVYLK